MDKDQFKQLSKEWVMTVLYDTYGGKDIEVLTKDGCKVMVYGHDSFDDFVKIVEELVSEDNITMNEDGKYVLTPRGTFQVKKQTILPLLSLANDPKYLEAFVVANREKCDIEFLENLQATEDELDQIKYVKEFAEQHYSGISKIIKSIPDFLSENPNFYIVPTFG